jgi:aminomethyltransferase
MRTPLYEQHVAHGARIVDFHGWEMPIQYHSIVAEHQAVRTKAGIFDVSHMGRFRVTGADRKAFLDRLLTVPVSKMAHGRCRYTFLLNRNGGIIDDLLVLEDAEKNENWLVVNAGNRPKDLQWLRRHAEEFQVAVEDRSEEEALIALQGPESKAVLRRALDLDATALGYYTFGYLNGWRVSRTGYTGEDGVEIFVPVAKAAETWTKLVEAGATPVGLGARDTLRTEASMPLYGNELDETTTPLEAGLDFAVVFDKGRDFIGRKRLRQQRKQGLERFLVGLQHQGKRAARHGYDLYRGKEVIGTVTSGTHSPTLQRPIALAFVDIGYAGPGTELAVDIRGTKEPVTVVPLPFYKRT